MEIATILSVVGLMMFPVIGLAQTSEIQTTPIQSATTVTSQQSTVVSPAQTTETTIPQTSTTPSVSTPTNTVSPSLIKCGVINLKVCNECGLGVYKNVHVQCSDGSEITLGEATSCKPVDLWNQYAKEACANHCSSGGWGGWSDFTSTPVACTEYISPKPSSQPIEVPTPVIYAKETTEGGNRYTPLKPSPVPVVEQKWVSVCTTIDRLNQNYNETVLELQKQEALSSKEKIESLTQALEQQKKYIEEVKKSCANPQTAWQVGAPPKESENKPVVVAMNRCTEVTQWETKITYYKKLSGSNDDELKKNGFSRGEIERILQELSLGIEKVKAQCTGQEKTPVTTKATAIPGSASITETVKPVVIESGQEISAYYKARLERAVSAKGEEKQIQELKTLRDEIDGLISNLIKSRKELEVSELTALVKEVKVSRGEIKADDVSVKTTEKKMLINVGNRPVSVEPTVSQVLIRDKGLEVNTNEVMIKENVLSVGGVDVKMSASEVTEKLGIAPTTIELKEENMKAVYDMKIDEHRKLFGFIPFTSQKTVTADAENGTTLSEQLPWYNFLTTK